MAVSKVHGQDRDALIAGVDLTNSLFRAVKINANKELVLCVAGDNPVGTVYETAPLGRPATFAFGAINNYIAGATVAAGARLKIDANAAVITALPGDNSFGTARNGGTVGEVLEVHLNASGATA